MRSFCYGGAEYRSLSECCRAVKVSYQKVRRLCRHYVRASQNPAYAVAWCTGELTLTTEEEKTEKYKADLELSNLRQVRFKDRVAEELRKRL